MIAIRHALAIAENRLADAGCPDPKIDAEWLYCHMTGIDRAKLFTVWAGDIEDDTFDRYFELVDRRASGVPLQHITGYQEFMGYRFTVNGDVLIPRQDTETLVEAASDVAGGTGAKKVLDLCTGSGAIAIALQKYHLEKTGRKLDVTATDVSEKALDVARANARALGANVKFVQGDLFEPLRKRFGQPKFDLIVSNPPYIPTDVIPTLQIEVRDHDPGMALDGGADGLDFYRRIVPDAVGFLKPGGILMLEIGSDQAAAVEAIAEAAGGYDKSSVVKDLAGRDRVLALKLK